MTLVLSYQSARDQHRSVVGGGACLIGIETPIPKQSSKLTASVLAGKPKVLFQVRVPASPTAGMDEESSNEEWVELGIWQPQLLVVLCSCF